MIRTYRDIRYTLKRSDRKTASIYVERDGQITLIRAPRIDRPADREGAGGKTPYGFTRTWPSGTT